MRIYETSHESQLLSTLILFWPGLFTASNSKTYPYLINSHSLIQSEVEESYVQLFIGQICPRSYMNYLKFVTLYKTFFKVSPAGGVYEKSSEVTSNERPSNGENSIG